MLQAVTLAAVPDAWGMTPPDRPGDEFEELRAAARAYRDAACRRLLSLPPGESRNLPEHVRHAAIHALDQRIRFLALLLERLRSAPSFLRLVLSSARSGVDDAIERARGTFAKDPAESLGVGLRAWRRGATRLLREGGAGHDPFALRDHDCAPWYDLEWLASWLDVSVVAVTWFLFGREDWMIHSTAEECCFLVKEYGLSYAARIEVAFRSQRGPSGSRVAQLSEADRQSDADFANWAARAVRSLVSEA